MLNMNYLEIYKATETSEMMYKLEEEIDEVVNALINNDTENIAEELLDVIQCCLGIAYTRGIKLEDYVVKHNEKLINRGRKFL